MRREKRILTEEEKSKIRLAKTELNEYRENIRYIEEKENDIEELQARLEKITTRLSKAKTNSNGLNTDKFSDSLSRLEELRKAYGEKLQELLLKKFVIDEKIEQLEPIYRNVLFYRYGRNMSWNMIASEMNYSVSDIYRKHGQALYFYSKL